MKIDFHIGDEIATYSRSWFTGNAVLVTADQQINLQSPWSPGTHFDVQPSKSWQANVDGHRVFIEKTRPPVGAAFRQQTYRISVDGQIVIERTGY
jgi:hypothetical protein